MKTDEGASAKRYETSKRDDSMNEMYKRFEIRSGGIPKEARISPREFGKQLAADLIEKIDKEVHIK